MRHERSDSAAGAGEGRRLRTIFLLHPSTPWEDALRAVHSRALTARPHLDAEAFARRHGALDRAVAAVADFAEAHDLRVETARPELRSVEVSGPPDAFGAALGLGFERIAHARGVHHRPDREVRVPPELANHVSAIIGLDERPLFRRPDRLSRLIRPAGGSEDEEDHPDTAAAAEPDAGSLEPREIPRKVAALYDFPPAGAPHGDATGVESREATDAAGETADGTAGSKTDDDAAGSAAPILGIILLGGGFYPEDMADFFAGEPPEITVVEIDDATNDPAPKDQIDTYLDALAGKGESDLTPEQTEHVWWTIEATADIQLAASFAPGARIVALFAPNSTKGKVDALNHILAGGDAQPAVVSCSWGMPEEDAQPAVLRALDGLLQAAAIQGISVCYSSGDSGADPGPEGHPRAHFPASSPHALACGGTVLPLEGDDPTTSQVVWNESRGERVLATGGGYSTLFERPAWQTLPDDSADGADDTDASPEDAAGDPPGDSSGKTSGDASDRAPVYRGLPDVAAKADYRHGYHCRLVGRTILGGGTSVAAPLWAGLLTRLHQAVGRRLGLVPPLLYPQGARETVHDILNGTTGTFDAGPGWDLCTGLGTPRGKALLRALLAED